MRIEALVSAGMPIILTVLRSGGEYLPEHVVRLKAQCERFAPGIAFRCLSDVDVPGWITLRHDWPGWWAKLEIFRMRGPCLYMDLDSTVVGDLEPLIEIARTRQFVTLRDFNPKHRTVGSGIMAWSGDQRPLYQTFLRDPRHHVAENSTSRWWGDQGFIERHRQPEFWQDLLPGAVVSWKKHCRNGIPEGARVVCFHGHPRPWQVGQ